MGLTYLNQWFGSSVFSGLQKDAFTVFDLGVPLGPGERHRRAHERHLTVETILGCRVLPLHHNTLIIHTPIAKNGTLNSCKNLINLMPSVLSIFL